MRLVTLGGSLAMVYMTCVGCPVSTDFYRQMGAADWQFGLLTGLPMATLALQFLGAYVNTGLTHRKPIFMLLLIASRLVYLPLVLLPFLLRPDQWGIVMWAAIVLTMLGTGMNNIATPIWLSWMSDMIPRRILNTYWGVRQRYMTLTWSISLLCAAFFVRLGSEWPVTVQFLILVWIGVGAGVVDIVLFRWVREPANLKVRRSSRKLIFLEPFRDRGYRSLVLFSCCYAFSAMMGASFMQVYTLKGLGLSVWKATLVWSMIGLGSMFVARAWGRLADRLGHRPILLFCVSLKPLICLVFLLVTPGVAFAVLTVAFFFDAMLNSGQEIATNGYMLKVAPRENRSMFIAALVALSGLAGGLGAISGGLILRLMDGVSWCWLGSSWNGYHVVFLVSAVLRILCIALVMAVREPQSASTLQLLGLLSESWPIRMLSVAVGRGRTGC